MNNHDSEVSIKDLMGKTQTEKELIEKIAPELSELVLEMQEIRENTKDPLFLSLLMYKLIKEKEQTNRILDSINEKYDKIMFEFKTKELDKGSIFENRPSYEVLPEQDQLILDFADKNQGASAVQIREALNYKGLNAASQRLNKLYKEGHLKKVRAGKKVLYLIR